MTQPNPLPTTRSRWLDHVFLVGLAGVFLVNAVVACISPDDFTGLVARSTLGQWLRPDGTAWMAPAIAINDLLLGVAVLAATRFNRAKPPVLAWAGAWLLVVTVVKLTALTS